MDERIPSAETRIPSVGDIVDLFEPAPRVATVTAVHSPTVIDVVDSDGGQHLSVTIGRKKHGWGWPGAADVEAPPPPAGAIAFGNVISNIKAV